LVLTWKPVTLPIAWQGDSGQDGSGVVAVLPSVTMTFAWPATLVPAASPATTAANSKVATIAVRRPRRRADSALEPACEDLDMPVTPLVDDPARREISLPGGRSCTVSAYRSRSRRRSAPCPRLRSRARGGRRCCGRSRCPSYRGHDR